MVTPRRHSTKLSLDSLRRDTATCRAIRKRHRLSKDKLTAVPRKELLTFEGGKTKGDPCQAMAYHGFNGIEQEVVTRVAEWITQKNTR